MNFSTTVSLSGNDTLVLFGKSITDVGDGDWAKLTFPNDLLKVKTGKNGNSIYAFDAQGLQADLEVRVIRGSLDDKFLNSIQQTMINVRERFVLGTGQLVKRAGNGIGMVASDTYLLGGGVPTRIPDASSNAEGDTEQAVAIHRFKFTNSKRAIL